ncbi:hypothetical protein Moror_12999 [Moniliophthora roreri MCA 2997]|uniref:Uncharacterized protein n=1 Tax=Moniliophthora roreri (strain MCA 2997) TaxID=1381753 RepID=V2XJH7_MONRO|nr:hypothetical protein Moror_12999 [Moniliophthora roreri MCA 2997]
MATHTPVTAQLPYYTISLFPMPTSSKTRTIISSTLETSDSASFLPTVTSPQSTTTTQATPPFFASILDPDFDTSTSMKATRLDGTTVSSTELSSPIQTVTVTSISTAYEESTSPIDIDPSTPAATQILGTRSNFQAVYMELGSTMNLEHCSPVYLKRFLVLESRSQIPGLCLRSYIYRDKVPLHLKGAARVSNSGRVFDHNHHYDASRDPEA